MPGFLDDDYRPLTISQDVEYAFALLRGIGYTKQKTAQQSVKKVEFPSATTRPTENEARAALARVLRAKGPPEVLKAREYLLGELANLFDPESPVARRKVVFKNPNQGHGDLDREMQITTQMLMRVDEGASYERAAEEVAELCGIGERQVKKIYQKNRDKFVRVTPGEDVLKLVKFLVPDPKALGLPEDRFRALEDLPPDRRKLTNEGVKLLLERLGPLGLKLADMSSDRRTRAITRRK